MAVTRLTAMIIQDADNDIRAVAGRFPPNGDYFGAVWLYRNGNAHACLLQTKATYHTPDEARTAAEEAIAQIRVLDLENPLDALDAAMSG